MSAEAGVLMIWLPQIFEAIAVPHAARLLYPIVPSAAPQAGAISETNAARRHWTYRHFFLSEPKFGCHPAVFWLGAAAIVLIFSFLGFFDSRFPLCSLDMSLSLV